MKKILISAVLLLTSLSPSVASASATDISSTQDKAIACISTQSSTKACLNVESFIKTWKPLAGSTTLTIDKNIIIKCLLARISTPTCTTAAKFVLNYSVNQSNIAQIKQDLYSVSSAFKMGIGSGSLEVSDPTGRAPLKGNIASIAGVTSVGKVLAYIKIDASGDAIYCISETLGTTTYRATDSTGTIVGLPCKSVNG